MIHELKLLPQYYNDVALGIKTFELRKNDRDFQVGDELVLREWDGEDYTGRSLFRHVVYIYHGCNCYGLEEGYCILGMKMSPIPNATLDNKGG